MKNGVLRTVGLALLLATTSGCVGGPKLSAGRGLHWGWTDERLQLEGYPSLEDGYSSSEWGVLYDDDGVTYGPKSYYQGREALDHPHLERAESYLESRWNRMYRSGCCSESLVGHYLEICDLAWYDLKDKLRYTPTETLNLSSAKELDEYRALTGHEYWVTHAVQGRSVIFSPIDVLFRRTLAGHAAFAAVAEAMLDLKCQGRIPPWLREGISSYLAEEGFEHLSFMYEFRESRSVLMHPAEVEQHIYPLLDRTEGRIARYNAFLMVWHLSETYGWSRVQDLLDLVQQGLGYEDAVPQVYGVSAARLLDLIDPVRNGEPTTVRPGYES